MFIMYCGVVLSEMVFICTVNNENKDVLTVNGGEFFLLLLVIAILQIPDEIEQSDPGEFFGISLIFFNRNNFK